MDCGGRYAEQLRVCEQGQLCSISGMTGIALGAGDRAAARYACDEERGRIKIVQGFPDDAVTQPSADGSAYAQLPQPTPS